MKFKSLLTLAQADRNAQSELIEMFQPLIVKKSYINNRFDEDLYQSLVQSFLKCIDRFRI